MILEDEVDAAADHARYVLRPGDVFWTGLGCACSRLLQHERQQRALARDTGHTTAWLGDYGETAVRTCSACVPGSTFRITFATTPSGSMTKVDRSIPMYTSPSRLFSTHTP